VQAEVYLLEYLLHSIWILNLQKFPELEYLVLEESSINLKAFSIKFQNLRDGYTSQSIEKWPDMSMMLEGYFGLDWCT
jgi:hypothetical protein